MGGVAMDADWPGYRGPRGDGISLEAVNLKWAAGGPKGVWKVETPTGLSSFAVAGGKAYTQVVRDVNGAKREVLVALNAADGKVLWQLPFAYKLSTAASPVVSGDIVYCSAGYGVGGGACRVSKEGDKFTAMQLYKVPGDLQIANHWSTPVVKGCH
jgi:outer membrane protein assembly factor BamB